MAKILKKIVSTSLKMPNEDIFGRLIIKYMRRTNSYLEESAVKLCDLKPDHRLLEIGFGPGVGLEAAYKVIRAGHGKVYGIDMSSCVVSEARKRFEKELATGKFELYKANVMIQPFLDDKFDRIIHCNCYYYWNNIETCAKEIYRVMKPGGLMVTTLSLEDLRFKKRKGWNMYAKYDPILYMTALENCGFVDVHIEYLKHGVQNYQAIYAKKRSKLLTSSKSVYLHE